MAVLAGRGARPHGRPAILLIMQEKDMNIPKGVT